MPTSSRCLSSIGYNLNRDVEAAIPYNKAPDYGKILQKINKKHPGLYLKTTYEYGIL